MSQFIALFSGLILIIIIGVTIPLILSDAVDVADINVTNPIINYTINNINASIPFAFPIAYFGTSIGTEDIIGEEAETYIINYLKIFSLIPDWLLYPVIILISFLIGYGIITWVAYLWDAFFL